MRRTEWQSDDAHRIWGTFASPSPDFYFFINPIYFINLEKAQEHFDSWKYNKGYSPSFFFFLLFFSDSMKMFLLLLTTTPVSLGWLFLLGCLQDYSSARTCIRRPHIPQGDYHDPQNTYWQATFLNPWWSHVPSLFIFMGSKGRGRPQHSKEERTHHTDCRIHSEVSHTR